MNIDGIRTFLINYFSIFKFKILDRYIFSECWLPFAFGCGIVTGVWLGADQVKDAFNLLGQTKVDFGIVFAIIILNIPKILLVTIPVGVLLASFLVFHRLSGDSEIIAMRASGISLVRVAVPILLFGLFMTGMNFFIGEFIVVQAEPLAQKLQMAVENSVMLKDMHDFTYVERSGGKRVGQGGIKRIFYVKYSQPEKNILHGIVIIDLSRSEARQIHIAEFARWNSKENGWELRNGVSYVVSIDDPSQKDHILKFERIIIPSGKSPDDIMKRINQAKFFGMLELKALIDKHHKSHIDTENINKLKVKFHQKFAFPFSCVALALIGAPMGILGRRSRTNWGYIQVALLVFTFFTLQSITNSMGETGSLNPLIACWIPNILLGGVGAIILWYKSEKI
jgi:lipopolysaccharide export system permease protein